MWWGGGGGRREWREWGEEGVGERVDGGEGGWVGGWVGGNEGGVYTHATCPVVVIERPARNGIASFASWRLRCGGFFRRGEDRRVGCMPI